MEIDGSPMVSLYTRTTLNHWGRATHICVGKLTIIGSDNGLSPGRRQAIIWTIAGILLIGPLGTNFSEILIGIQTFSFKIMRLKVSSAKWRPFCLGLNELMKVSTCCDVFKSVSCWPGLSHSSKRSMSWWCVSRRISIWTNGVLVEPNHMEMHKNSSHNFASKVNTNNATV